MEVLIWKKVVIIVPLWFIPPIAGGVMLWREFSWLVTALLVLFLIDSFLVLPLVSKRHCCAQCPQKETCPWMGSRGEHG